MRKLFLFFGAWIGVALAGPATAQVVYLDRQHMDFRIQYDAGAEGTNRLDIILGYDTGSGHFTTANTNGFILATNNLARLTIPNNANYFFLGTPGAPVWVLPQSQNIALPYLGTSAEDVPDEVFDGPVRIELVSAEGPGNFFAWANTGGGNPPLVKFICTNGVVSTNHNVMTPIIGSHEHYNWGFSTNGLYRITLRCTGVVTNTGVATNIIGKDVAWAFQILPMRPWESWISTNWLPATATNIAGVQADPDGDEVKNILEYAFGTDPNHGPATDLPAFKFVTSGGTNYGALTWFHNTNAADITATVMAANSLNGVWSAITNSFEVSVTNNARQFHTIRDDFSAGESITRFYRLDVQRNPN